MFSKLFSNKKIYYNIDGRIDDKEQIVYVDENVECEWHMIPEKVKFEMFEKSYKHEIIICFTENYFVGYF